MKKRIVFVNQSSGYLMIDIIHEHLKQYDEIILLTGNLNERNKQLSPHVKVHYLTTYKRNSTIKRLITWLLFTMQCWFLLIHRYRKAAIYWVSNPPFTIFLARIFMNRKYACLVYDVYPDILVRHGILSENNRMVRFWAKINKQVWNNSDKLITISDSMRNLMGKTIAQSKVDVVPVWTDNSFLKPLPKNKNPFVKKYNLDDKFVVMYSGNLGVSHPLEVIINVAENLQHTSIIFLIIGDGAKKEQLKQLVTHKKLQNVKFLPFQPTENLPYSLSSADLGIVTLGKEAANLSVPSKTYNLMSVGVPILVLAEPESEVVQLIQKHQNGYFFKPDQIEKISNAIKNLSNNKQEQEKLKEASIKASKLYTPDNAKLMVLE